MIYLIIVLTGLALSVPAIRTKRAIQVATMQGARK